MEVAITGGTGFIGRALVLRHLAAGDTVRVLSRRSSNQDGFPDVVKLYSGDLVSAWQFDIPLTTSSRVQTLFITVQVRLTTRVG